MTSHNVLWLMACLAGAESFVTEHYESRYWADRENMVLRKVSGREAIRTGLKQLHGRALKNIANTRGK